MWQINAGRSFQIAAAILLTIGFYNKYQCRALHTYNSQHGSHNVTPAPGHHGQEMCRLCWAPWAPWLMSVPPLPAEEVRARQMQVLGCSRPPGSPSKSTSSSSSSSPNSSLPASAAPFTQGKKCPSLIAGKGENKGSIGTPSDSVSMKKTSKEDALCFHPVFCASSHGLKLHQVANVTWTQCTRCAILYPHNIAFQLSSLPKILKY